ncbi:HAD-IA family hydrolase [Chloroflexi bacterium TSY]|nr:HAD-IA family hydrolase [Chloroflexi bacterium TSY]
MVDSRACIERHWAQWAHQHEIDVDELLEFIHGRPAAEIIRRLAPHLNAVHEAEKLTKAEAADMEGVFTIEGAVELLEMIPEDSWAIATSGTREIAENRIRHCGLPFPRLMICADDVLSGKPAPDPYILAARGIQVPPSECIVIEDSPAGIESAHTAGMKVVAVASTHDRFALRAAELVIEQLSDIQVVEPGYQVESRLIIRI